MEWVYNDGGRKDAGYKGEVGDCVARSIAIAAQLPYKEVYNDLAWGNGKERRTRGKPNKRKVRTAAHGIHTKRKWFKDYMQFLGFTWVPTMFIGQGCKIHLKADELPAGRLVVATAGHYQAVIDHVIYDIGNDCDERRCVYGYWIKQ
jgi:hypothetical protein